MLSNFPKGFYSLGLELFDSVQIIYSIVGFVIIKQTQEYLGTFKKSKAHIIFKGTGLF